MAKNMTKARRNTAPKHRFHQRNQRIYDFLVAHPVGVLSTSKPDGRPYGSVIYFVVNEDFTICFLTRLETQKADNLEHDSRVMLTAWDLPTQTYVQIAGTATKITDSYDVNGIAGKVLGISMKLGNRGLMPVTKIEAGPYIAFLVEPEYIHLASFTHRGSGESDMFESVESFDYDCDDH